MIKIKQFTLLVNNYKTKESHPNYKAFAKIGDKWHELGAGWKSEKSGVKALNIKLGDNWTDHTDPSKSRDGWVMIKEKDLKALEGMMNTSTPEPEPMSETTGTDDFPFD